MPVWFHNYSELKTCFRDGDSVKRSMRTWFNLKPVCVLLLRFRQDLGGAQG